MENKIDKQNLIIQKKKLKLIDGAEDIHLKLLRIKNKDFINPKWGLKEKSSANLLKITKNPSSESEIEIFNNNCFSNRIDYLNKIKESVMLKSSSKYIGSVSKREIAENNIFRESIQKLPNIEENDSMKVDFPSLKKGNSNVFDFSNYLKNKNKENIKLNDSEPVRTPNVYKEDINKLMEKKFVPNIKLSELKDKNKTIDTKKESFPSPKSTRKIISNAYKTQAGIHITGDKKKNQDSQFIKIKFLGQDDFHICSVLDGHGVYGNLVSNYVRDFMIQFFSKREIYTKYIPLTDRQSKSQANFYHEKYENLNEFNIYKKLTNNNYELIRSSFHKSEESLELISNIDILFSGTTCVMIFIIMSKIICANVGDSRAIMISSKKNSESSDENTWEVKSLSRDHKPDLPDEKERIIKNGGKVDRIHYFGRGSGPFRVWKKNENSPGIAMSRSIGDLVAANIGVISEPEIFEYDITNELKYIVLASDGVWEFLSNNNIMEIINPYYINKDPDGATQKIVEVATNQWKKVISL